MAMASAVVKASGKELRQPKQLPAPNADFYEVTELLNPAIQRSGLRQPMRFFKWRACPALELLPAGPTGDFTRDGDNLHLLTTLNSPPRGCCATLFPATRSSNQSP